MRILVVSNLYPPYYIGGYELGCKYVVDKLRSRGHDVRVVTSTYGVSGPKTDGETYRVLEYSRWGHLGSRSGLLHVVKKEYRNQKIFRKICGDFNPDMVYIWNLTDTSVSLAFSAERRFPKVNYFVSDNWLTRIDRDPWRAFWAHKAQSNIKTRLKHLLRGVLNILDIMPASGPLELGNAQLVSQYLYNDALNSGVKICSPHIVYWGVDINKFPYRIEAKDPRKLLYVGHIMEHKGIETVIRAMARVVYEHGYEDLELSVIGKSFSDEYEERMRSLASSLGLTEKIDFRGSLPHEALADAYMEHDILIFPSVWGEPFSITLLEGMSSGLAVVGTTTGGSAEILRDGENSMVFDAEDNKACADKIAELLKNGRLYERIRKNGRLTIEREFTLEDMIDNIERTLLSPDSGSTGQVEQGDIRENA